MKANVSGAGTHIGKRPSYSTVVAEKLKEMIRRRKLKAGDRIPTEADLAAIFTVAEQAGIAWLKFDSEAAVIDGLPVFDMSGPEV